MSACPAALSRPHPVRPVRLQLGRWPSGRWVCGIESPTFIVSICRCIRRLATAEAAAGDDSLYVSHPEAGARVHTYVAADSYSAGGTSWSTMA